MEVSGMLKKSVAALFGLVFAMALIIPPKANAEVVVGVGVGVRPGYGYVVARPQPRIYVAPAPYVAYAPGYVYPPAVYPGRVVVGVGYARRTVAAMAGTTATAGSGSQFVMSIQREPDRSACKRTNKGIRRVDALVCTAMWYNIRAGRIGREVFIPSASACLCSLPGSRANPVLCPAT